MPPRTTKTPSAKKPPVRRAVKKASPKAASIEPVVHRAPRPVKHTARTYTFAVGRRKQAVARVRLHATGSGEITINDRPIDQYLPGRELGQLVRAPFLVVHQENHGRVSAKVAGGGIQGQAEAIRLGIARALVKNDPDVRIPLKRAGYLRRDPRVKERKKYGLRRARRAPQWQKR